MYRQALMALLVTMCSGAGVLATAQESVHGPADARPAQTTPSPSNPAQKDAAVFTQNFGWDDHLDSGHYIWGQDGFLKMDGSSGKIDSRYRLKHRLVDGNNRLKIAAVFVPGHRYRILLNTSDGTTAAAVTIERDRHITLGTDANSVGTRGPILGCGPGISCHGAKEKEASTGAQQLHIFSFSRFDSHAGTMSLQLDDGDAFRLALAPGASSIDEIAIQTLDTDPGSIVWLRKVSVEDSAGTVIEDEAFPAEWIPNVSVTPGYPADKWQVTTYRPADFSWLEMKTHYGAVYVRFSEKPILRGSVQLEIMTDNVENEVQVNLGKYRYEALGTYGFLPAESSGISTISGGWTLDAGIYDGTWTPFRDVLANDHPTLLRPYGIFKPFDNPPAAIVHKFYLLTIAWDVTAKTYRVWIDGVLQEYGGSHKLPMSNVPAQGLDMLMIHAGDLNPWRGPVLRVDWGKVRIDSKQN